MQRGREFPAGLEPVMSLSTIALLTLLALAVGWDLATRRIPNAITVSGGLAALGLRGMSGWEPLVAGALGLVLGLVLALPLVALGAMGGGDAKLLAAVGAFLGPGPLVTAILVTALAGGVLAIVVAARWGALAATLAHTLDLARRAVGRSDGPRRTLATEGALAIPYAVPIAIGAMVGWFAGAPWGT